MTLRWLLPVTLACLFFFAFHLFSWPSGVDFHFTYYPQWQFWRDGIQPYTIAHNFYNPPWTLFFLYPFGWMGEKGGQAALALFSIVVLIQGWRFFARELHGYPKVWSLAVCLVNLHTFDLFFRGQLDALVLLGLIFIVRGIQKHQPYQLGMGWVIVSMKPTSVLLLLAYTVYWAYQEKYLLKAMQLPALVGGSSFLIFGLDWPLRWYETLTRVEPQTAWLTTLWRAADYLNLHLLYPTIVACFIFIISIYRVVYYRMQPTRWTFSFLAVSSLLITPYALSYHYSVAMMMIVPPLVGWNWRVLPLIFSLTLLPLTRLVYGVEVAWIDMTLPLVIWIASIYSLHGQQTGDATK